MYFKNLYQISTLVQNDFSTKEIITEGPHKIALEVSQIPVHDAGKKKIGSMYILRDITREKEVERLKTSFVSIASHQLRTPLSGIKWSLHTLLHEEPQNLSDKQRTLIEKTLEVNDHLVGLVNDLLDVSRIEEGRFGYDFVLGDISNSIQEVIGGLQANALKKKVKIKFKKPGGSISQVSFDKKKLDLAMQNIIDNALKYSRINGHVDVSIREGKTSLLILVEDNGIGIPKNDQKFIFNKFFRAENAVKFQTEGSGLGLYIAKNIVEQHNGLLYFESIEDKGTTFTIQLPLEPKQMPKGRIGEL